MNKFKIVHIITGLGMGGAERSLFNIVTHMDSNRFEHVVISLTDQGYWGGCLEQHGIKVYALGMGLKISALSKAFSLCKLLKELKPDCIQTWLHHANVIGLICARLIGNKNVVWNIRCGMLDLSKYRVTTRMIFRIGAWLSRFPRAVINNSRISIKEHIDYGYLRAQWLYIANGFNTELFQPRQEIYLGLRNKLGLANDAILIGIVARFDPAKDHATFIRAAGVLARQIKNVYFVCVGRNIDENNQTLIQLIQQYNLHGRIFLLGEISETHNIYPGLDYLTQTSLVEGFPNVIGEAMACAVECVATDVGETTTLLGQNNFVIPKSNPGSIAATWLQAINRPISQIMQCRQQNREYIIHNFSLASVASRYADFYYTLITQPKEYQVIALDS